MSRKLVFVEQFDDLTFSVPLFVLFGWRMSQLSYVFSSHEETSEMPLSSSTVLRRFRPHRTKKQRGRSGERCAAFIGKRAHFLIVTRS
ncbi:MAG TPA: hypothetical protein VM910_30640 [Bradyrhizobium sp.]|jgi:hypothetical protein|nr:hypothetical protein [Bradyrhizobium sp.]